MGVTLEDWKHIERMRGRSFVLECVQLPGPPGHPPRFELVGDCGHRQVFPRDPRSAGVPLSFACAECEKLGAQARASMPRAAARAPEPSSWTKASDVEVKMPARVSLPPDPEELPPPAPPLEEELPPPAPEREGYDPELGF